jgi:hypothetical protein
MKRSLSALLVLLGAVGSLGIAAPATAQVDPASGSPDVTRPDVARPDVARPDVARIIEQALMRMEGEPPAELFARLGDAGREHLIAISSDPARPVGWRRRAVIALQYYRDALARAELMRLATDGGEDAIVSRYALRSLARAFGSEAWSTLVHALDDGRANVREGAVLALAELDRDRAAALLGPRITAEPAAFVRSTMRAVIDR